MTSRNRRLSTCLLSAALALVACDQDTDGHALTEELAVTTGALAGADEPGDPATVLIRYWSEPTMRGSGTLVAPNVVLSNAHATWGGGPGMYVQLGTYTTALEAPMPVLEKLHHPGWVSPSGAHDGTRDLALLRLACNVTDVSPARLNRRPLETSLLPGDPITAVAYGPTAANTGTDWGTKRSVHGSFASAGIFAFVAGVSAYSGDSGGSLFAWPRTTVGPGDDDEGEAKLSGALARQLIGVITYAGGTSVRVDRNADWIQGWIDAWADPAMPDLPRTRTLVEETATSLCQRAATVGVYSVGAPEAGVTYTWSAIGAALVGDTQGTTVEVIADSNAPFTLEIVAMRDDAGCGRRFEQTFTPAACRRPKGLRGR